jgi:indoleamine 2,3-dioxygenase
LRRAHHVLAFLVHFYVHSRPPSSTSTSTSILIPKSLAVPLVSVSRKLGIAPVLTFADTVLWNHEIIDKSRPLDRNNIRPLTLFTEGSDEANFYGCCAEIELRGVEALRAIARFYDMTTLQSETETETDLSGLTDANGNGNEIALEHAAACLKTVARVIRDLTVILQSVREICDPHAFYFAVRPWFRGSDAAGPAATASSQRWIYQGVDEKDMDVLELSGPSAGQSSIIHTFDIFLDVDHSNNLSQVPNSSSSTADLAPSICPHAKNLPPSEYGTSPLSQSRPVCPKQGNQYQHQQQQQQQPQSQQPQQLPNGEFMNRMRLYMPGSHQAFLEQLTKYTHEQAERRSIRKLAAQYPHKLLSPYNEAVLALKQFRDAHIRIACLYVVSMSRKAHGVPHGIPLAGAGAGAEQGMPSMCPMMRQRQRQSEPVRGTGGNELSLLLKSCRDATSRTLLTHQ